MVIWGMVYDALIVMVYGIGFATLAYFNTFVGFLSIIHSRGLPVYHSYIVYRWIYNGVTMWLRLRCGTPIAVFAKGLFCRFGAEAIRTTRRKNLHLGVRWGKSSFREAWSKNRQNRDHMTLHDMLQKKVQHGITICFLTSGPVIHASRNTLIISDVLFVPFVIFHNSPGTNGWWHKPSFIQVLSHHGPLIDDLPVVSTTVIFHSYMN